MLGSSYLHVNSPLYVKAHISSIIKIKCYHILPHHSMLRDYRTNILTTCCYLGAFCANYFHFPCKATLNPARVLLYTQLSCLTTHGRINLRSSNPGKVSTCKRFIWRFQLADCLTLPEIDDILPPRTNSHAVALKR